MIALLIGGTVVLCTGLLAVVYGVPIKEFSFGNTMILAGSVLFCTGLILIGLSVVVRELKNLTRRLDAGISMPASVSSEMPGEPAHPLSPATGLPAVRPPLRSRPGREDTLFSRDQPFDTGQEPQRPDDAHNDEPPREEPVQPPAPWLERSAARTRTPQPFPKTAEPVPAPASSAERPRRNIMFSSHRRDSKNQESPSRETTQPEFRGGDEQPPANGLQSRHAGSDSDNAFAAAWPQSGRQRTEVPSPPSGRASREPTEQEPSPSSGKRFEQPRRADPPPVTIVKSGVVDSMAYSLYSDGSIEAQMPEGMVRFASIDELRAHLDQRG